MNGARVEPLVLAAVAYAPKVVTIWEGFRRWTAARGLPIEYVLYSGYERQVVDLVDGRVHVAWNSPLAWLRAARLAAVRGVTVRPVLMRDTDRDVTSVVVVRADAPVRSLTGLRGRTVATGAVDSPQATLIPLAHLRDAGLEPGADFTLRRFDVGVGLHGDHVGGEREAARALAAGTVDAACLLGGNHEAFERDGTLAQGSTRVLARTAAYDHCNMTAIDSAPAHLVERFVRLLRSMSADDPEVAHLLDLEGLRVWCDGRATGYAVLDAAVDADGFYGPGGEVLAGGAAS